MMASDGSSSLKCFHSRSSVDLDHTCGSIFVGINMLSAFCATNPLSTTVGLHTTVVLLGLFIEYSNICSFWGCSIRWDLEYSFQPY